MCELLPPKAMNAPAHKHAQHQKPASSALCFGKTRRAAPMHASSRTKAPASNATNRTTLFIISGRGLRAMERCSIQN